MNTLNVSGQPSLTVELSEKRCTLCMPGGAQVQSTIAGLNAMLTNQLGHNGSRQITPLKWVELIAETGASRLVCNTDRSNASFSLTKFTNRKMDWNWHSQFWGPRGSKQWSSKNELVLFDWFLREDFPEICENSNIRYCGDKTMSLLLQALLLRNPFWGLLTRDERKCVHNTLRSPFLYLRSIADHDEAVALLKSGLLSAASVV